MRLITLSTQYSDDENQVILWSIDRDSRLLIKAHLSREMIAGCCIGDCLEVDISSHVEQQEVWITNVYPTGENFCDEIEDILEKKAATPYSIIEPMYVGNVAKVKSFEVIEDGLVIANIHGFPKERKYLTINDNKWKKFVNNDLGMRRNDQIINAINRVRGKYLIVDFPANKNKGNVNVAALVVM